MAPEVSGTPVLHLTATAGRRGAEVFAMDLAAELATRGGSGEVVALAAPAAQDGLTLPRLGERAFTVGTLLALRRRSRAADVVVAHGSRTLPACALALPGTGVPFVYRSIGDPSAWSARGLRRRRTRILLRRAALIVALWPGAAHSLTAIHGVSAARIRVIGNGVPAERCPVVDDVARLAARAQLGLSGDAPVLVYVGSLTAEKNVDEAIKALAMLPSWRLIVVGDGPQRSGLAGLADRICPGRVHFLGTLPDTATAMGAADVVVLPSRTEGMPAVLIEAGLRGLPTVATDVGGVSEVVVHEETGILVQPGDTASLAAGITRALAMGSSMGEAARSRCRERFEISVVADMWAELLAEVPGRP